MNKTPSEAWQMTTQTADESFNEISEGRPGEKEKENSADARINKLFDIVEKLVATNPPYKKLH